MKVVILGYGQMLMNLIAGCIDADCDIVGVFRYDKVRYTPIERVLLDIFNPSKEYNYIKSHKLYEIKARSVNSAEFKKEILKLNVDIILVGSWGERFKKVIINLPKIATINVHPSILPKYRGPNPYLQVIKNMEKESGVTFHLMDEKYDTGPILLQKIVKIEDSDTAVELREKIANVSREAVCELIKELENDIIIPLNQDEKRASYYSLADRGDIELDFSKPADVLSAHIRAFHPWQYCCFLHKHNYFVPNPYKIEILENHSECKTAGTIIEKSHKDNSLTILCGDNKLMKLSGLKLYGFIKHLFTSFYIKNKVEIFENN